MRRKNVLLGCLLGVLMVLAFAVVVSANPASIVTGAFDDGECGTPGAQWRLYDDEVLVVDGGFIHWDTPWESPWQRHHLIEQIIFTAPITAGTSLQSLFSGLSNVTAIEGLCFFDTGSVTNMSDMFAGASGLTSLDLSGWDTGNVTNMQRMFSDASGLTSLDLSGWDTRNVTAMTSMMRMFIGANNLRQLRLGEYFRFRVIPIVLSDILPNATFTGFWQNVGAGTPGNPRGEHVFTSSELLNFYRTDPPNLADTWVWQRHYPPYCPDCNEYPCRCNVFGPVPPTGTPDISLAMYAMFAFASLSAGLWSFTLRPKRRK